MAIFHTGTAFPIPEMVDFHHDFKQSNHLSIVGTHPSMNLRFAVAGLTRKLLSGPVAFHEECRGTFTLYYGIHGLCFLRIMFGCFWKNQKVVLILLIDTLDFLCMRIFMVKTLKRVLLSEVRSCDSSRHHYLLLFIALAQLQLFFWLGNITVN
ncbi:protein YIF1B [Artemisia annua]|uniref:Protein YIF1B n=1 Tax=Artemisia annua TaxID=35608 RepID=A0A2U1N138_ARTAN|nr:protein YIF1B [Artemisia annua]